MAYHHVRYITAIPLHSNKTKNSWNISTTRTAVGYIPSNWHNICNESNNGNSMKATYEISLKMLIRLQFAYHRRYAHLNIGFLVKYKTTNYANPKLHPRSMHSMFCLSNPFEIQRYICLDIV